MVIIVDGFGGDNAPAEIVKGCEMAIKEYNINIKLVGNADILKKCFEENNISCDNIQIIHAPDVVTMEDEPRHVIKNKPNSSMIVGLKMLANNEGDAFISAGNSGALVTGATLLIKRIRGIKRAAFAPVMPSKNGCFMLIDSGANLNCIPLTLKQFGVMGSCYMECVMGIKNPKVGLVNVGTESHKGTELYTEAFKLLQNENINFIGNIEGRDVPEGIADVVVADGFTGNVLLKVFEGVATVLMDKIKAVFTQNLKTKIAAGLVLNNMKQLKKEMDYKEYGGAPILGVKAPVFKAHGSSDAKTFKNALGLTVNYVKNDVITKIKNSLIKEGEDK